MGPPESPTSHAEKQAIGRRKGIRRRPRTRRCLLKGCEERFHPRQSCQRYCSAECRKQARRWSRWKAQQSYRATTAGKEKRNGQSRRYRERVRRRKPPAAEGVDDPARVMTTEYFFRPLLRPAWLLREILAPRAKSLTTFLFGDVPARGGAGPGTGAALETGAHLIRRY
jgi:hypothetical protein